MSSPEVPLHRTFLYAPGSRPELMQKALHSRADAVVLDLEDAVPQQGKAGARAAVVAVLESVVPRGGSVDVPAVHVRINRGADGYDAEDLAAVVAPGLAAVRLPKVESAASIRDVDLQLSTLEAERGLQAGGIGIYPTFESAVGVLHLNEMLIASSRVVRAALGTADLLADLGARGDDDLATLYVRSQLVLASRGLGVGPPIDSVHTDLGDAAGLRASAVRARALGFFGKSVIHPQQIPVVHEVYSPTPEEAAGAERLIGALEDAEAGGVGALAVDSSFIDAATAARARALLRTRRTT